VIGITGLLVGIIVLLAMIGHSVDTVTKQLKRNEEAQWAIWREYVAQTEAQSNLLWRANTIHVPVSLKKDTSHAND
jgi:hypothetical protein